MSSSDFYTGTDYLDQHPSWHREEARWKASQVTSLLDRHAMRPKTVLDVGCGTGDVLATVGRHLPDATRLVGCDVSSHPVAMGPALTDPRLELIHGDPPADETFDLLLCIDVLEHVEDYIGFLRGLRGKATHTILHIPLDTSAQTVLRAKPFLEMRRRSGHLHYFTRETALATMETSGYKVLEQSYTRGALESPPQSALALLARWPRRAMFALDADLAARVLGGFSLLVLAR